jgi:hypothetical protein
MSAAANLGMGSAHMHEPETREHTLSERRLSIPVNEMQQGASQANLFRNGRGAGANVHGGAGAFEDSVSTAERFA